VNVFFVAHRLVINSLKKGNHQMAKWNEASILQLIISNDRALERAIIAIYNRQTEDEKSASSTRHTNGIGFAGPDASLGSYYAKWLLSGRSLSGNHLLKARKMMMKYRGQLTRIANQNEEKRVSSSPETLTSVAMSV
jgi:hypothetical protein